MSYNKFYEDFKNNKLGPSVFLYGEEDFLIDWAKELIISRYVDKDNRSYDVVEFDGADCNATEIMQAARAYSMFSDKRVVVVSNYPSIYRKSGTEESADDEALLTLAAENQDSAIIIFTLEAKYYQDIKSYGKKLAKQCSSYDFSKLEKNDFRAWISKRIHANGKMIGRREMDYLIDLSGYCYKQSDYYLKDMATDIIKICNASEGDAITIELIEDILVGAEDKFVFNLIDALVDGNKNKAMELGTAIVLEDDASMMVLSLLTKQFEIMYDSLELSESGMSVSKMASATATNEFRFKKAYNAARRFNKDRLKQLLIRLYDIDKDIKSGNIDKDVALELFIATV